MARKRLSESKYIKVTYWPNSEGCDDPSCPRWPQCFYRLAYSWKGVLQVKIASDIYLQPDFIDNKQSLKPYNVTSR